MSKASVRINPSRVFRNLTLAASVTAAALLPAVAQAEQFVLFDVMYTHGPITTKDSHYSVTASAQTPSNWKAPIDYSTGTAYLHLEVMSKPTDIATKFQVCVEGVTSYACTDQSPTYTKTGTVKWPSPLRNFYQYANVDWSKGIKGISAILKDTQNGKPAPENVGATESAKYMPTTVRLVMTLVSPGGTYVPPDMKPADAGVPVMVDAGAKSDAASMGGQGAGGSGGAGGGAGAGSLGAGGKMTGGAGGAATQNGGSAGGAGSAEPSNGGNGGSDNSDSKSSQGCSLAGSKHVEGRYALALLGLLGTALVRRRSRRIP